jgi:hypothetical protein
MKSVTKPLIALASILVLVLGISLIRHTPPAADTQPLVPADGQNPEATANTSTSTTVTPMDTVQTTSAPTAPVSNLAVTPQPQPVVTTHSVVARTYTFSPEEALAAITRTTIRLSVGADIPLLVESGARLNLTGITDASDGPTARIELRRKGEPERFELITGGTIAVSSEGTKQVVIEAASVTSQDDAAVLRILSFPAARLVSTLPASVALLQRQTLSYVEPTTGTGIKATIVTVLENKVQVAVTEYENGAPARSNMQWIVRNSPYQTKSFELEISDIVLARDPAYSVDAATWAPHTVTLTLRAR